MRLERVAVVGAGAWGTALAQAAAMAGRAVSLVARDRAVIEEVNQRSRNAAYLGDLRLSEAITALDHLEAAAELVILAVPAQASRGALSLIRDRIAGKPVVLSAKGLETGTLKRQSEILAELAPTALPFVLSGPSFATDVAAGRPTAVTLAGNDPALTEAVAAALAGPALRPYAADDIVGVELAGALKNVYAIASGAIEGAGLGASARSALIARGFAELSRLVGAMGGQASTLAGLAGLGDLTLSCTSTQSRNYRYGVALGRGVAPSADDLAEGVATAPVAQGMARGLGIDAPLIDAVNLLLAGEQSIDLIVAGLMSRPLKREDE
jgi:glycerol-3-phosphate dehydrogenase (NAD(P)+)